METDTTTKTKAQLISEIKELWQEISELTQFKDINSSVQKQFKRQHNEYQLFLIQYLPVSGTSTVRDGLYKLIKPALLHTHQETTVPVNLFISFKNECSGKGIYLIGYFFPSSQIEIADTEICALRKFQCFVQAGSEMMFYVVKYFRHWKSFCNSCSVKTIPDLFIILSNSQMMLFLTVSKRKR